VRIGIGEFGNWLNQAGWSNSGWNNQFSLPYELGMYYNFTLEGPARRPSGCPGINMPVSEYPKSSNMLGKSYESNVMECNRSAYAPEGEKISDILDEFADDHEIWAKDFLDSWVIMTSNGASDLKDGPENSWLGHYTIKGHPNDFEDYDIFEKDFGKFIEKNNPLVITDPNADPFLCGHWGREQDRCGHHVSEYDDRWRKFKPY